MEKNKANQLFSKFSERKRKTHDLFVYIHTLLNVMTILYFPVKFKLSPDIVIFFFWDQNITRRRFEL